MYMEFSFILSAFIGGLLTFLAPCTLPLIPGYLAYISGVSLRSLQEGHMHHDVRMKVFYNSIFFVVGFSAVFIFFGVVVGFLGQFLASYRGILSQIGGLFIIIFGILMIESKTVATFLRARRFAVPKVFQPGRKRSSFIFGLIFGLGWSPCIGPVLGSILLLASSSASGFSGAFLLAVYSFGLAIPFVVLALFLGSAQRFTRYIGKYSTCISWIGGIFLIMLGILVLTKNFGIFSFINTVFDVLPNDALLEYL